ncbi:MAG: NUDIX hydrolase [Firmicutes bacterium]|nr:NUDIX hydrolase [Bacillota bacterium]
MEKLGIGVGIILLNENQEVLLLLRNDDALLADSDMRLEGTYTLPSGKVKYGETFEEAAVRKTKDESNIDIDIKDLQVVSLSNDINEYAHYATIGLIATKYTGEFKLKNSGEFSGYGWFKLDELPSNLCVPSIKIINNYFNNVIYSDDINVRKLIK